MFGELALIDESPRSASARAKTYVVAKKIDSKQLHTTIQKADPFLRTLLTAVMTYFRSETERLKIYQYSQNLEHEINIRQRAMEEAFAEIHNGPLQTLAMLLKEVQEKDSPQSKFLRQLKALDLEIRKVGEYLTETVQKEQITVAVNSQDYVGNVIRLGDGTILKLDDSLEELFYSIFTSTLQRNFPYFQNIRIKLRDFETYPDKAIDLALKKDISFCFEEALCNVGKHAKGTTKIIATGKLIDDLYVLKVQDNGCGLISQQKNKGTELCQKLIQRLKGNLIIESLPEGGVLFQMSWKI